MKILIFIFTICFHYTCISQKQFWELSGGLGISGANQIIKNDVSFDNYLKFRKKNNYLDNKFKNNDLHTGYITLSKLITKGGLKNYKVNATAAFYTFGSAFYKEDKFTVSFGINDTINTPNWLITKYSLPFFEIGLSKEIKIDKKLNLELGFFMSYMVELSGTSRVILLDSVYYQWEEIIYYFNKEYPNHEFEDINYGVKASLILFPLKKLHPIIQFTQSLNDISKYSININQHANIWSLNVGLTYNFYSKDIDQ